MQSCILNEKILSFLILWFFKKLFLLDNWTLIQAVEVVLVAESANWIVLVAKNDDWVIKVEINVVQIKECFIQSLDFNLS